MSAAVEPAVRPEQTLERAAGIELLGEVHGSGYRAGASLVRRPDGQVVQLGPLMYALLEAADGRRSAGELADDLCERIGRPCDEDVIAALARKLAAQGLLAGHEHNAPPRRNPLLALRWKVLITNPRVTRLLTAPFALLFRPWIVWPVVASFVAVCWLVLFREGFAAATSDAFQKPELLLLLMALVLVSAALHEIGHAAACRYGGAAPGGMGAGIYLVWPAFYTDVTDAYRLPRTDRLRVDLGGIYFNAVVAVVTTAVWLVWRVDALLLLVGLQLLMMVKNLSPVIRSDGYHILSDATGIPDLYAHIKPTLLRLLPWRREQPTALRGRARALVTVWVLVVVPVLLAMMAGAVLLLPHLLATAWDSGRTIVSAMGHEGAWDVLARPAPPDGACPAGTRQPLHRPAAAPRDCPRRPQLERRQRSPASRRRFRRSRHRDGARLGLVALRPVPPRPGERSRNPRRARERRGESGARARADPARTRQASRGGDGSGRRRDEASPRAVLRSGCPRPAARGAPQLRRKVRGSIPVPPALVPGAGRHPGARGQHHRRRGGLQRRVRAHHRVERGAGDEHECRLRLRTLHGVHHRRRRVPGRPRRRTKRQDRADQRGGRGQLRVPRLSDDRGRRPARDHAQRPALRGAAREARGCAEAARCDLRSGCERDPRRDRGPGRAGGAAGEPAASAKRAREQFRLADEHDDHRHDLDGDDIDDTSGTTTTATTARTTTTSPTTTEQTTTQQTTTSTTDTTTTATTPTTTTGG